MSPCLHLLCMTAFAAFLSVYVCHGQLNYKAELSCDYEKSLTTIDLIEPNEIQFYQLAVSRPSMLTIDTCDYSNTPQSRFADIIINVYDDDSFNRSLSDSYCESTWGFGTACGGCGRGENFDVPLTDTTIDYFITVELYNTTEIANYSLSVTCNPKYQLTHIDSATSNISGAESKCMQEYNSSLAVIESDADLQLASAVLRAMYNGTQDISAWLGVYQDTLCDGEWRFMNSIYCKSLSHVSSLQALNTDGEQADQQNTPFFLWLDYDSDTQSVSLRTSSQWTDLPHIPLCNVNSWNSPDVCNCIGCPSCWDFDERTRSFPLLSQDMMVLITASYDGSQFKIYFKGIETANNPWGPQSMFYLSWSTTDIFDGVAKVIEVVATIDQYNPIFTFPDNVYLPYHRTIFYGSTAFFYFSQQTASNYSYHIVQNIEENIDHAKNYTIPYPLSFSYKHREACIVANDEYLFVFISSQMFILDLLSGDWQNNQHSEMFTAIDEMATCVMDRRYEQYIYLFGVGTDYVYKYYIESGLFTFTNTVNLCSSRAGSAATTRSNKAYLHGCYVSTWQTLVFNLDSETFLETMGPNEGFVRPEYQTALITSVLGGTHLQLQYTYGSAYEYNVFWKWQFWKGLDFAAAVSHSLNHNIWPTDVLQIDYTYLYSLYVTGGATNVYDDELKSQVNQTDVSLLITCNIDDNTTVNITDGLINSYSVDDPQCRLNDTDQIYPWVLTPCSRIFSLETHLPPLSKDTVVHEIVCSLISFDVDLEGDVVQSVPDNITVNFNRCGITFSQTPPITDEKSASTINISYSLSNECYNRTDIDIPYTYNFLVEIEESDKYRISENGSITVSGNKSHECNLGGDTQCAEQWIVFNLGKDVRDKEVSLLHLKFNSLTQDLLIDSQFESTVAVSYSLSAVPASLSPESIAAIVAGGAVLLFCIIVLVVYTWRRHKIHGEALQKLNARLAEEAEHTYYMKNPLVLFVGIAWYRRDENVKPGLEERCDNLDGIDADYRNVKTLCNLLNYDFYPKQDEKYTWKQDEIVDLVKSTGRRLDDNLDTLQQDARDPNKTVDGYDGLMMFFSGHGIRKCIVTSDYQLISKTAIHRMISSNHPNTREVPRVVMFDCCDGSAERGGFDRNRRRTARSKSNASKNFDEKDIEMTRFGTVWKGNEKNPDYKLCEIHGANEGYQAKLHIVNGSYLIYEFVTRMIASISKVYSFDDEAREERKQKTTYVEQENAMPFIGSIVDAIQERLHDSGKQHIRAVFNDRTRYVKLIKNDIDMNHGVIVTNTAIREDQQENASLLR